MHSVMSQCFGGSLWREGSLRSGCGGGSLDSVFWWLAVARRQFTGRVCWWELRHSFLMARFGEKAVYGPCVLVGLSGGSLWRESSIRAVCVGGRLDSVSGRSLWREGNLRALCVGGSVESVSWCPERRTLLSGIDKATRSNPAPWTLCTVMHAATIIGH